jgi:hypothetical protein
VLLLSSSGLSRRPSSASSVALSGDDKRPSDRWIILHSSSSPVPISAFLLRVRPSVLHLKIYESASVRGHPQLLLSCSHMPPSALVLRIRRYVGLASNPIPRWIDLVVSSALLDLFFFYYLLQVVGHRNAVEDPVIHELCVVLRSGAPHLPEVLLVLCV